MSTDRQVDRPNTAGTTERNSAIKVNDVLIRDSMWMNLENTMVRHKRTTVTWVRVPQVSRIWKFSRTDNHQGAGLRE